MAIAGFVLALIGALINPFAIPSILSIIFSAIGMKSSHKGLAIAGLVIGIISTVWTALVYTIGIAAGISAY